MRVISLWVLVALALGACQWVKPIAGASDVALVKPQHVSNCKRLGTTTSSVKDAIGFLRRGERKVADELITLAKNVATKMGGDSILAVSEVNAGEQDFEVYDCRG